MGVKPMSFLPCHPCVLNIPFTQCWYSSSIVFSKQLNLIFMWLITWMMDQCWVCVEMACSQWLFSTTASARSPKTCTFRSTKLDYSCLWVSEWIGVCASGCFRVPTLLNLLIIHLSQWLSMSNHFNSLCLSTCGGTSWALGTQHRDREDEKNEGDAGFRKVSRTFPWLGRKFQLRKMTSEMSVYVWNIGIKLRKNDYSGTVLMIYNIKSDTLFTCTK